MYEYIYIFLYIYIYVYKCIYMYVHIPPKKLLGCGFCTPVSEQSYFAICTTIE